MTSQGEQARSGGAGQEGGGACQRAPGLQGGKKPPESIRCRCPNDTFY